MRMYVRHLSPVEETHSGGNPGYAVVRFQVSVSNVCNNTPVHVLAPPCEFNPYPCCYLPLIRIKGAKKTLVELGFKPITFRLLAM